MRLNEILDRLTAPSDVADHDTGYDDGYEYAWNTKNGNRVTLNLNVYKPNACEISFDVNYEMKEETRDIDKEIISTVFYRIGEFIKSHNINEIKFEPIDDSTDYVGFEPSLEKIRDFLRSNFDQKVANRIIALLPNLIQNKKVNKEFTSMLHMYTTTFTTKERNTFTSMIQDLENIEPSTISGQNRRQKLYLYAIKKYLPDWTVKSHSSYIYAYKQY